MSSVHIYIPFDCSGKDGSKPGRDVGHNGVELEKAISQSTANGRSVNDPKWRIINTAYLYHTGNKLKWAGYPPVKAGDIVVINGHGSRTETSVSEDGGGLITMNDLMTDLEKIVKIKKCKKSVTYIFYICFSAMKGHIADVWKQRNPKAIVYGADGFAEGGLCKKTRSSVTGICSSASLRLIPESKQKPSKKVKKS